MARSIDAIGGARPPTQAASIREDLERQRYVTELINQTIAKQPNHYGDWPWHAALTPVKPSDDRLGDIVKPILSFLIPKTGGGSLLYILGCAAAALSPLSLTYVVFFNTALGPVIQLFEKTEQTR